MTTNPKQHRFKQPGLYLVTFQALADQCRARVQTDGRVMVQSPLTGHWHEQDPDALAEAATATFRIEGDPRTP